MGKKKKKASGDDITRKKVKNARKHAREARRALRKEYEATGTVSQQHVDQYKMCNKKRAYKTETEAMMAAAHSRSGDTLRWYQCPYSNGKKPHWHLTKKPDNGITEDKPKKEAPADRSGGKPIEYHLDDACYVVRGWGRKNKVSAWRVYPTMEEAEKWIEDNQSDFHPFREDVVTQELLRDRRIRKYNNQVNENGVLTVDRTQLVSALVMEANGFWETYKREGSVKKKNTIDNLEVIRDGLERIGRGMFFPKEFREFLANNDSA